MDNSLALPITSDYFTHDSSKDGHPKNTRERRGSMRQPSHPISAMEMAYLPSQPSTPGNDLSYPNTPGTLSRIPSPTRSNPPPLVSTKQLLVYRATMYWAFFVEGWNDGAAGPLLSVIREEYGLNFTLVSMLFVAAACGFLLGAGLNIYLTDRYGLGKIMTYCAVLQMIAYTLIGVGINFPVMCFGYGICGMTMALHNAQGNIFVALMPGNATSGMGMLHGFYGIGAMTAPLASTQFATRQHWSYFYFISLGVAAVTSVSSLFVFKLKPIEELIPHASADLADSTALVQTNKYKEILRQKSVLLLAAWSLVYVGAEVTIGGWVVTFLQQMRGGGSSTGYVSSGFFGGLTVGRFVLWPVTDWLGGRRAMYVYGSLAVVLEIIVWKAPNLIADAVAVSFVGLMIGPLYPIVMNVSTEVLPRWILAGSIGFVASFGQMGSALFPFLTGLLATSRGVQVLQPLVIALLAFMMVNWALFLYHSGSRRQD
ncbi:hypothetical protein FRB94_000465 [Tulasnella sp. JGI-2019a]|nr:hypothetical protein FRB94_000465 [Tulasnella sp. JGI-2019a]